MKQNSENMMKIWKTIITSKNLESNTEFDLNSWREKCFIRTRQNLKSATCTKFTNRNCKEKISYKTKSHENLNQKKIIQKRETKSGKYEEIIILKNTQMFGKFQKEGKVLGKINAKVFF